MPRKKREVEKCLDFEGLRKLVEDFVNENSGEFGDVWEHQSWKTYHYTIVTKAGVLVMSFSKDADDGAALLTRFVDVDRANNAFKAVNINSRLNTYSGKWDFHFTPDSTAESCMEGFRWEFNRAGLKKEPSRHDEALKKLRRMYDDCLSLRSGAGRYTLNGSSSKGVAANLAGIAVPIDLVKALLGESDDETRG